MDHMMKPNGLCHVGWPGAELFVAAQAAAQGAGMVALKALQQENSQLRAKVALLESSLERVLEDLRTHGEAVASDVSMQRLFDGHAPEDQHCSPQTAPFDTQAPMPARVLRLNEVTAPPSMVPAGEPALCPPPQLGILAPPPGLWLPGPALAHPTLHPEAAPTLPTKSDRNGPSDWNGRSSPLREDSGLADTRRTTSSSPGGLSDGSPRELPLQVHDSTTGDSVAGASVDWRVECVNVKLRANCGFPLVSPTFSLGGVLGLRLMFVPGATWAERQGRINRKPQTIRRKIGGIGESFNGAVKLKCLNPLDAMPVRFYLFIGGRRQGPCTCDFTEHAIQGCNIECNWQDEMDQETDCLTLHLEFV